MKTVKYQRVNLRCLLFLFVISISFVGKSQCQYFIDSLNTLLKTEKSHFKRAKIFMNLAEEWKDRDKNTSTGFITLQNNEAEKITNAIEKAEFILLCAGAANNANDTLEARKLLMSAKDILLNSGNKRLIGSYWGSEANYLRLNHQENEESHKKIEEIILRSINTLAKEDAAELIKPYLVYFAFLINDKAEPQKLIKVLNETYKIIDRIKQPRLRAKHFHSLGRAYNIGLRKPADALKCYISALKDYKRTKDSLNIGGLMINIGDITYGYGDKEKSKEMIFNGMNICLRNVTLNPKKVYQSLASAYQGLVYTYEDEKQTEKVFDAYRKAIYYNNMAENYYNEPLIMGNMAAHYSKHNMHDSAMILQKKALQLRIKFKNKEGILFSYGALATAALKSKQYDTAVYYANKSLEISKEIKTNTYNHISFQALFESYKALNKYELSNYYMERYFTFMDSVRKTRSEKELTAIVGKQKEEAMSEDFERKEAIAKLEIERNKLLLEKNSRELLFLEQENNIKAYSLEKSKSILRQGALELESNKKTIEVLNIDKKLKAVESKRKEESIKQQRKVIYGICIGGAVVLALLFFVFKEYNQKKKANKIIVNQKKEVEEQKQLIEEKQTEIIDSINYAKRIQFTLLANTELLKNNLSDSFVCFKPKDIVSGDFYWATKKGNLFYLAVCDSTGHGVPGAFMSLLNISFLNEAINEKNILKPNEILNHVRDRLIENISKDGGQDGMDAILLCIDKSNNSITYAAANNTPIIISNGRLIELEKDKMPVGKGEKNIPFILRNMDAQKGDIIYLYTDGYADQFGGPKGKKFKYKNLNNLLLQTSSQSMKQQKNTLETEFSTWKGDLGQVDDVCLIGIKI